MAKSAVVDVKAVAQSGVTVKRAWFSAEIWNYALGALVALFGLAAFLAPTALPFIHELGLSPAWTMGIVLGLNAIIFINGWVLKLGSTTMIGNHADVKEAKEAVAAPDDIYGNGH